VADAIIYNNPKNRVIRKKLRQNSTEAEKVIWSMVRSRQIQGLKFYRQYGIGKYIVDFYCPSLRLAIELDGGQHNEVINKMADEQRADYLKLQNVQVLRFWNNDVLTNKQGVYQKIIDFITPLTPLTLRGGSN
jgi:very-short-patch-repair endonuclease